MLRLRVLSAVAGVPVLLLLAVAGGVPYVVAVAGGAVVASAEVFMMLTAAGHRPLAPLGIVLVVALVLTGLTTDARLLPAVLVVAAVGGLAWTMRREDTAGGLLDWAATLATALYVGGTMHYFVPLRWLPDGLFWVLAALVCTWACDIIAFFVGRRWGRARLAPRISPGKSVEGAVGGLLGTVVVAVVLGQLLGPALAALGLDVGPPPALVRMVGFGLVVAGCAVLGDLVESFIKRQCGAKDSGVLIPGHGGVLDRIDSVIVAIVGAYFYVVATA